MDASGLIHKFEKLPVNARKEMLDFLDFLTSKYKKKKNSKAKEEFTFDWEGGLSELKHKSTSVDLQHKANQWR